MHERLRLELLRRIQRGRLASHCWHASPVLGRRISPTFCTAAPTFSRCAGSMLAAQHLGQPIFCRHRPGRDSSVEKEAVQCLGLHATALFEPYVRTSAFIRCCDCGRHSSVAPYPGFELRRAGSALWRCALLRRRAGHGSAGAAERSCW